ncbi:cellulose biosynthesis cyclic di-GMP-binding regulatory protein BcsB, partial [Myxococcota bacterium]|nr:cellulose biosynthesis cyclic di-GMP-binding regulatory protein BcsB [Myxococcota bacterium]
MTFVHPLALALALVAPSDPAPGDVPADGVLVRTVPFERVGLGAEALERHVHATLGVPFHVRRDRVLVSLAVHLAIDVRALVDAGGSAVELRFGDGIAAVIEPSLAGPDHVEVTTSLDAQRAGLSNVVTLALRPTTGRERVVPPGTWRFVVRGVIELGERPLTVAPLLATLALPFFDPDVEADE